MNLKFLPVFFVLALLNGAYAMDEEDPSNVPESCHRIVEEGWRGFFNKKMESAVVFGLGAAIREEFKKESDSVKNTILDPLPAFVDAAFSDVNDEGLTSHEKEVFQDLLGNVKGVVTQMQATIDPVVDNVVKRAIDDMSDAIVRGTANYFKIKEPKRVEEANPATANPVEEPQPEVSEREPEAASEERAPESPKAEEREIESPAKSLENTGEESDDDGTFQVDTVSQAERPVPERSSSAPARLGRSHSLRKRMMKWLKEAMQPCSVILKQKSEKLAISIIRESNKAVHKTMLYAVKEVQSQLAISVSTSLNFFLPEQYRITQSPVVAADSTTPMLQFSSTLADLSLKLSEGVRGMVDSGFAKLEKEYQKIAARTIQQKINSLFLQSAAGTSSETQIDGASSSSQQ